MKIPSMLCLKTSIMVLVLSSVSTLSVAGPKTNAQAKNLIAQTSVIIRFKESMDENRQRQRKLLMPDMKSTANISQSAKLYSDYLSKRDSFDVNDPRLTRLQGQLEKKLRNTSVKHFSNANIKALSVGNDDLAKLRADSTVDVFLNRWHKPMLSTSVPIVFPDQASSDYSGSGQVVVLLDTGTAANHSFLSNKLVSDSACFSNEGNPTAGGTPLTESLCIAGAASSTGGSSGTNCDASVFGCWHGTNMAGIIAGSGMTSTGVAIGAKIFSIQVGTKINDETICGDESITPCVAASTVDLISALEYSNNVVSSQYSVASVNISLGTTDALQGQCDSDPIAQPINNLANSGIAVVAASGNAPFGLSGNSIAMSSPACVSSAIAVAATNDADAPLMENNRSSELDLFAPGFDITTSTLPISTFSATGGTSAAAAHVSAAFAVLKEKNQSLSVSALETILKNSGVAVIQGLITRSRIDITQALAATPELVQDDGFCVPIKAVNGKIALICL